MKLAIALLCLIPLVLAEKRLFMDSILNPAEIKHFVDSLVSKFGSDATEAECEKECVVVFTSDLLDKGCDFLCKGAQSLIQRFHHTPAAA